MPRTFWRLTKAKYARAGSAGRGPLSGYGSTLHAGRWHPKGRPVVYAAESTALALLETLVHVERADLLRFDLLAIPVTVPDALADLVETLAPADLPPDWRAWPYPISTQTLGAAWFDARRAVALVVPSAVVPHERNVLLNPAHPRFGELAVGDPEPFPVDPRLTT